LFIPNSMVLNSHITSIITIISTIIIPNSTYELASPECSIAEADVLKESVWHEADPIKLDYYIVMVLFNYIIIFTI
jgi:hypothetical protein